MPPKDYYSNNGLPRSFDAVRREGMEEAFTLLRRLAYSRFLRKMQVRNPRIIPDPNPL